MWRSLQEKGERERERGNWSGLRDHGRFWFVLFFTWCIMLEYSHSEEENMEMENMGFTQEICLKPSDYEYCFWLSQVEYLTLDNAQKWKKKEILQAFR